MRRHAAALALTALLATGLTACGGGDDMSDVVPRSTPDLVAPEDSGLPPASTNGGDERTSTSTTSTTETTPEDSATDGGAATPAAPATPAEPQAETPPAGGQPAPTETQAGGGTTTGGGNSGGFSDFCAENPGACPEE